MNTKKESTESSFAIFGGGCFWCMEAVFQRLKGVSEVIPGYAGGHISDPVYQEVCAGNTGHAEVIGIYFESEEISYENLLEVFWFAHDPTTLNRQGNDVGTQYRSVIFYTNERQKQQAFASMKRSEQERQGEAYTTEILSFKSFYPAESYHRDYYDRNSNQMYCSLQIAPKIKKIQKHFSLWMKKLE